MSKVTPDPPRFKTPDYSELAEGLELSENAIRALRNFHLRASYLPEKLFMLRPGISNEEALTSAYEILECAKATAYECAQMLRGPERKLALAMVHLVEMAQTFVGAVLERPA